MSNQTINITNFKTGFDTYDQPENMPDDAFPLIDNALIFRGVLKKRDGTSLLGNLSVVINAITNAADGLVTTATNHGLITGDEVNFVDVDGMIEINNPVEIVAITNDDPGEVTTSVVHGLTTGDTVTFSEVRGMIELNNLSFTVTVTSTTTFTIGTTTIGFGVYETPSGIITKVPFTITFVSATSFTIGVDTTGFGVYVFPSGRVNMLLPVQGLHVRQTVGFLKDLIAFNTTQAFLFNTATDVFDNISGTTAWTGLETDFFWPLNYQSSFFVTNNLDPIRYNFLGTVWTDFTPQLDLAGTTLQRALMIFSYKDRMIALNTTEGGSEFRQRVRFSQIGSVYVTVPVPANFTVSVDAWREDVAGRGGFLDAPTDQNIITAGFVRDTLVVVFEFSAWRLVDTGNRTIPFTWQRLHSQLGAESTYSVVGFDDGILSIGRAGVTITDTNQQKRIDQIIPDQVYEISNETDAQKRVHGIRDYQRQLVYWCYPEPNSETFPTKVLVYNYIERNWAIFSQSFTTFGEFYRVEALIWGEADQEWQFEQSLWASGDLASGFPRVVAGNSTGKVVNLDPSLSSDEGIGYDLSVLTKKFNPWIEQGLQSKAIYMYLLLGPTNGVEITINHFINEGETGPAIASYTVTADTNGQAKVWIRIPLSAATAQYHQFQFTLSQEQLDDLDLSVKDINIYHIMLEMAPAGRLSYGLINT